jgi:hypothetical protein
MATAIAGTSLIAGASSANAGGPGYWNNGPYPHHKPHVVYRHSDPTGPLVAGAIFGLALGAIASDAFARPAYVNPEPVYLPPPTPNYAAANYHFSWCSQQYRSYNAERDTFFDYQGIERPCVDPYQYQ